MCVCVCASASLICSCTRSDWRSKLGAFLYHICVFETGSLTEPTAPHFLIDILANDPPGVASPDPQKLQVYTSVLDFFMGSEIHTQVSMLIWRVLSSLGHIPSPNYVICIYYASPEIFTDTFLVLTLILQKAPCRN